MPNRGCVCSSPVDCDMRSCEAFLAELIVPSALDNRANTPIWLVGESEGEGLG